MPKGFLCKFLFFITSLTKIMYCTKRPGNICCLVEHTHLFKPSNAWAIWLVGLIYHAMDLADVVIVIWAYNFQDFNMYVNLDIVVLPLLTFRWVLALPLLCQCLFCCYCCCKVKGCSSLWDVTREQLLVKKKYKGFHFIIQRRCLSELLPLL